MDWAWIYPLFMIIIKFPRVYSEDYIGCFEHGPDYNKKLFGFIERTFMENNNGLSCKQLCHPYYPYSGTEGTYCYCGNMLRGQQVNDNKCNTPCPDQRHSKYTICGGTLRMSMYHVFSKHDKSEFTRIHVPTITTPDSRDPTSPLTKEGALDDTLDKPDTDRTYTTLPNIPKENPTSSISYVTTTRVPRKDPIPSTVHLTTSKVPRKDATKSTIYVTASSVPEEYPTESIAGSTTEHPVNLKTAATNQLTSSVKTKINIVVTICAIGTFAVVCLFATVKLFLFLKRRRLCTGRNIREEDLYIRPVYVPSSESNSNERNSVPEFHNNVYDYVEDMLLTNATSQLHFKQDEISSIML